LNVAYEGSNACKALGRILKAESEIKNFFPQGNRIKSDLPGLVVVHPFYFGFKNGTKPYFQPHQTCSDYSYLANMKMLLSNSDRNLFLFETCARSRFTLDFIAMCRSHDGLYLVETGGDSSFPVRAGLDEWKNMADKMLEVSGRSEFEFAGGELYGDIKDLPHKLKGCLGGAFAQLSHHGVKGKFKEGCCYHATAMAGWDF